jgi:hypothetical protein
MLASKSSQRGGDEHGPQIYQSEPFARVCCLQVAPVGNHSRSKERKSEQSWPEYDWSSHGASENKKMNDAWWRLSLASAPGKNINLSSTRENYYRKKEPAQRER